MKRMAKTTSVFLPNNNEIYKCSLMGKTFHPPKTSKHAKASTNHCCEAESEFRPLLHAFERPSGKEFFSEGFT